MARTMNSQHIADGLTGASYGATERSFPGRRSAWGASVFLLAGALIVLSVLFGSNDDSSEARTDSHAVVSAR